MSRVTAIESPNTAPTNLGCRWRAFRRGDHHASHWSRRSDRCVVDTGRFRVLGDYSKNSLQDPPGGVRPPWSPASRQTRHARRSSSSSARCSDRPCPHRHCHWCGGRIEPYWAREACSSHSCTHCGSPQARIRPVAPGPSARHWSGPAAVGEDYRRPALLARQQSMICADAHRRSCPCPGHSAGQMRTADDIEPGSAAVPTTGTETSDASHQQAGRSSGWSHRARDRPARVATAEGTG